MKEIKDNQNCLNFKNIATYKQTDFITMINNESECGLSGMQRQKTKSTTFVRQVSK